MNSDDLEKALKLAQTRVSPLPPKLVSALNWGASGVMSAELVRRMTQRQNFRKRVSLLTEDEKATDEFMQKVSARAQSGYMTFSECFRIEFRELLLYKQPDE